MDCKSSTASAARDSRAAFTRAASGAMIARWPGRIQAHAKRARSRRLGVFPTLAELAGTKPPAGPTAISFAPALLDRAGNKRARAPVLEFPLRRQQAVRMGRWKRCGRTCCRQQPRSLRIQLYDSRRHRGDRRSWLPPSGHRGPHGGDHEAEHVPSRLFRSGPWRGRRKPNNEARTSK